MGQVCEGDREVLDLEQIGAESMQISHSKPIITTPPEEDKQLMAAPAPPQMEEESGPKSKAVLLDGGLSIS